MTLPLVILQKGLMAPFFIVENEKMASRISLTYTSALFF